MRADSPTVARQETSREHAAGPQPAGVLLIDKPAGITSHDAVDLIRKLYRTRRVGHTGTLDPMASGLLLILLGNATKVAPYLTKLDKTYRAAITFGAVSDTGDAQGTLTACGDPGVVNEERLREQLRAMIGEQQQRVPDYSAVQVDGQRLYKLARRGKPVPDVQRRIHVYEAELLSYASPVADVRFRCSSGTYVRALTGSLGDALGCGAHLSALRREAVGRWRADDASDLDRSVSAQDQGEEPPSPQPIEEFLDYPRVQIQPDSVEAIAHGIPITIGRVADLSETFACGALVVVSDADGRALAIGEAVVASDEFRGIDPDQKLIRYRRVLA
jgi:tRNA pseudouridine55 synthase